MYIVANVLNSFAGERSVCKVLVQKGHLCIMGFCDSVKMVTRLGLDRQALQRHGGKVVPSTHDEQHGKDEGETRGQPAVDSARQSRPEALGTEHQRQAPPLSSSQPWLNSV